MFPYFVGFVDSLILTTTVVVNLGKRSIETGAWTKERKRKKKKFTSR